MPGAPWLLVWSLLAGLILAGCGHDAPRQNPLDPGLTPPVELTATLSDSTGAVSLSWTRYKGESPFAAYLLLRRAARSTDVDTLSALSSPESTTAIDTSLAPGTSYIYQVAVTNTAGLTALSDAVTVSGYTVGAVALLAAEADPQNGAVRLRWTRFADPGFEQYRVDRHQVGTDIDTTIYVGVSPGDTSYADTTARHLVPYSYVVHSVAAGQTLTSNGLNTILELPAVDLSAPTFESDAASARLHWSTYSGPRFGRYEVQRRTSELAYAAVAAFDDDADTSYTDTGLRGDTEYIYRIAVITSRDEAVLGLEHGGAIHRLVDTWELTEASRRPGIRLHRHPETGHVEALLSLGDENLYTAVLAPGRVLTPEVSLQYVANGLKPDGFNMATALGEGGERVLLRHRLRESLLSTYRADGSLEWREDDLRVSVPDLPSEGVENEIAVSGGFYRHLVLSSAGEVVLLSDFSELPSLPGNGQAGPWEYVTSHGVTISEGVAFASVHDSMLARGPDWAQLSVTTQVAPEVAAAAVRLGPATGHHLIFTLAPSEGDDPDAGEIALEWFAPSGDGGAPHSEARAARSHNGAGPRDLHLLQMGVANGEAWAVTRTAEHVVRRFDNEPVLCSATNIQGVLYATIDDSSYAVTPQHRLDRPTPLAGRVAETRAWQGRRSNRVGIALPDENTVLFGDVVDGAGADWPSYLTKAIGPAAGTTAGFLVSPISFDAGPDGRFYVLDAGNRRIVVFDSVRRYVTEFGGLGDGPGQFNFGGGGTAASTTTGFFGSVAVDADGYIYVADEINRRIQVFEP